jgi:prephenate dehydrogenase
MPAKHAGIAAADADLFKGQGVGDRAVGHRRESSVQTVVGLAQLAGATPLFMDADEHDSYVAAISHLPLLLSSALFSVAFGSAAWPELAQLASSGFRAFSRSTRPASPCRAHPRCTAPRPTTPAVHRYRFSWA